MSKYADRIREQVQYMRRWRHYAYANFLSHFEKTLSIIRLVLETLTGIASVACLVSLIVYVGYDLSPKDARTIKQILRLAQLIFGINVLYQLIFFFKSIIKEGRIIRRIVDIGILLSLVIWVMPHIEHPWIPVLADVLMSNKTLFVILGAYSIVDISYTISRIPGRRTNPSLLLALSFLVFIILGSFALMLPKCTYHGISYIDSLFVASSAVSITGLTSVDLPSTFTPLGLLVLSVLIQLGSLGIITFTSFFALFFTGNTSIYNQLLLRDVIYSKSMNALVPTLLYVLGFTLTIEVIGAVCVYFTVPEALAMGTEERIVFAAFHSMSSFCNAGFSCLNGGMSNPVLLGSNQYIYIVTSVLIFAGGIGFPILVNLREILRSYIAKILNWSGWKKEKAMPIHIYDLNTKLVLYTTLTILAVGTAGFFTLEYNNTLKGMSLYEKTVQSIFNALIPRSAGFASVNPANFLDITLLLVLVQMVIGGSSQSMAGGIKVNTFGAVVLNLRAVIFGHKGTTAFRRTISPASVRRANAVVIVAAFSFLTYLATVMLLEPEMPTKSLVFEVTSALFTVGSSLGVTPELSDVSKAVLSTAMFLGRVGILSMLAGFIGTRRDVSEHYPVDSLIIN